ncbi:unnamed protein product [Clonostachys rhizophaga]|uniref:ABC transporter domain-containing protein n=1 Tax=Clonostachys rhizophaga TaxID=160324 RepID=A0A9N9YNR2_9HYPO|nr:unnamed protein product [Clonostachys rhizophaga]
MELGMRRTRTRTLSLDPKTNLTRDIAHSSGHADQNYEDWELRSMVENYVGRDQKSGYPKRGLGVTWQNLTVQVASSDTAIHENIVSQFNILKRITEYRKKPPLRTILDNSHGCVKPGEMLLVLGRPGSGCTTLLKQLSNQRHGYMDVSGSVHYGSLSAQDAGKYRGQIVMNTEDELFFPTLSVEQTMDFATRLKVPFRLPEGISTQEEIRLETRQFLPKCLGIERTRNTKVGSEYVRGISGGERKRVSIIETLATKGSVLVLDGGRQIFYGPMREATPFMEALGFICQDGANTADFLTSVTVPTERETKANKSFPTSAEEIQKQYEASPIYESMVTEYDYPQSTEAMEKTDRFVEAIKLEKASSLGRNNPMTISFTAQLMAYIKRQCQILWGDKVTVVVRQAVNPTQAFISGSLFYNAPDTSSGVFLKTGACFLALLFNILMSVSEVISSFSGRPILIKHQSFAFFHPAAFCLAQIVVDIPIFLGQISAFSVILYFLVGLDKSAENVFYLLGYIDLFYNAIGASLQTFDAASKISGLTLLVAAMYSGYMIPKTDMHHWFEWLFWINPIAYGLEGLLTNEFHGRAIRCVNHNWAFWSLFAVLTIMAAMYWRPPSDGQPSLVTPCELTPKASVPHRIDEEAQTSEAPTLPSSTLSTSEKFEADNGQTDLIRNTSIFTWKNLTYTVKTPSGDRVLLDNVQGWVQPGVLTALMGSSGAGKTTLLDGLAQRKTEGTIRGSIMVDGYPLPISFQRCAGYCEQLDVHEPYAAVREALEFSALLRQDRKTPYKEKLRYVDAIIDLFELHDIADRLIGSIGNGLNVEQRKRITIGVELVSKPSILIFLDEPTSGIDGQSAYSTVRFLRRLAAAGKAILVTIHQPSAQFFGQFDKLLLLTTGGKTVYFGDIGDQAQVVKSYFERNGAPCPAKANPAEHIIDVVSGAQSHGKDWSQAWLSSGEYEVMSKELEHLISTASSRPATLPDDSYEFAVPLWEQIRLVSKRMSISLYRNTGYVNNKFILHIFAALLNGFSFWKIGNSYGDMQLQRDVFEAREKKSTMYSWVAFVTGLITSEVPYLVICAVLYFIYWYYTAGLPSETSRSGSIFFVMLMYEFLYTDIGQFIAAYAPNDVSASLVNPLLIGILVSFCGVLTPYTQIPAFWRHWIYWLNPFNYLMGSMLVFSLWGRDIECSQAELAVFDPPNGLTCGEYLGEYLASPYGALNNLTNPGSLSGCQVCPLTRGEGYLYTLNLDAYHYGWRDAAVVVVFVLSSYGLVYLLMKLRSKTLKTAQ